MAIEEGAWAICVCISYTGDGGQLRCRKRMYYLYRNNEILTKTLLNNNNNNNNNNNRKTFDRFTTKDSYAWNITHNTESTAV
jgi:hypothetical protein